MQLYLHPPVLCSTVCQLDQHTLCHHKFCKRQIGGQSLFRSLTFLPITVVAVNKAFSPSSLSTFPVLISVGIIFLILHTCGSNNVNVLALLSQLQLIILHSASHSRQHLL